MTKLFTFCLLTIVVFALPVHVVGQPVDENGSETKVRVGIFDSRAVAIAYYRSKPFKDELSNKFSGLKQAKAEGNEKLIKQLETEGPELQQLMHQQSFGTWPIDNVLKKIKNEMPAIAKQADVQIIVSKWDIAYQQAGIEFVDVTNLMVAPFEPDQATRKVIKEIREKAPVPANVLKEHKH